MKVRIIERTYQDGTIRYVIQTTSRLFRVWRDGDGKWLTNYRNYTFRSLEEAKKNICYFDGTKIRDILAYPFF